MNRQCYTCGQPHESWEPCTTDALAERLEEVDACDSESCTRIPTRFLRDDEGFVTDAYCERCWDAIVGQSHRITAAALRGHEEAGHTDMMVSPESVPDYSPAALFGAGLRDARVAAGLSLREAAALLGTTTLRLGQVERGDAPAQEPQGKCPNCEPEYEPSNPREVAQKCGVCGRYSFWIHNKLATRSVGAVSPEALRAERVREVCVRLESHARIAEEVHGLHALATVMRDALALLQP